MGKPYLLGGDGGESTDCGKFTLDVSAKAGVTLNYRTADGQYLQAEQEGKLVHDISQAQKGDLVFWHVPSNEARWATSDDPSAVNSDDKAYKGVTHVGVYMGDGKVAQAGSGGVSIVSTDIYPIVGVGKFSGSAKGYTDGELLQKREEYMKAYKVEVSKRKKARAEALARQKEAIQLQLIEMGKNGASSGEMANFLDNAIGDNKELTLAFGSQRNQFMRANEREQQAANQSWGMNEIRSMIGNNKSQEEIFKFIDDNHINLSLEQYNSLRRTVNDRDNGTGDYAPELAGVNYVLNDSLENMNEQQKGLAKIGFKQQMGAWVAKFRASEGREPTNGELDWAAHEIAGQTVIQTTNVEHFWQNGDNYKTNTSLAVLAGDGVVDWKVLGDTHYVRLYKSNGDFEDIDEGTFHARYNIEG